LQIIKDALRLTPVKAIFCEKPISDKARNVERVIRACERRGVILQIDHQRRFDPLHRQLRQMIMKKTYGVPQRATFYYTAGIGNTGTHMFDLLRFFFGEPKWISAVASPNPSYKDGDPNFDGMVQFESDLVVSFAACDVQNYLVFELDCFCQEARFILKSSGFDLLFFKKGPSPYFSGYSEVIPSTSPFRVKYQRSFMLNAVEHLVQCVKSGRESLSSGWDGLMALRMIEAAKLSAAQDGKKVSIFKV
jgi:predicted dehydrogenase